jgi:hypothetical protein
MRWCLTAKTLEGPLSAAFRARLTLVGALFLSALALWSLGLSGNAQPAEPQRMSRADEGSLALDDEIPLPPDAKAVVLPRQKYQELLVELARLREQIKNKPAAPPQLPSVCKLSGQVNGDLVRLHAQFKFRTERGESSSVLLGCLPANLTEAKLDDHLARVSWTNNGYVVQVENAGEHQCLLELELALASRTSERGFALDLPGAAVTTLELDFPETVKEVHLTGRPRPVRTEAPTAGRCRLDAGALGPLEHLDVSWAGPPAGPTLAPQLEADARITVRVDEAQIVTEVFLVLTPQGGPVTQWTIQVPSNAEIVRQTLEEPFPTIEVPDIQKPVRVLRFKEASVKPLTLTIRHQQVHTANWQPVGPFAVLGAVHQRGTITFKAPRETPLSFQPRPGVSRREIPEAERRVDPNLAAVFQYWGQPGLEKPPTGTDSLVPAPLDFKIESGKSVVQARTHHDLRLLSAKEKEASIWEVTTTIEGRTLGSRLEQLGLQLPPGFQFDSKEGVQPAGQVQGPEWIDPLRVRLTLSTRETSPFKVVVKGTFSCPAVEPGRPVAVALPRPLDLVDQGGDVTIQVPEDLVLEPPAPNDPCKECQVKGSHRQVRGYDSLPDHLDVLWKAFQAQTFRAIADLELAGTQAHVTAHRLWFNPPIPAGETVRLRLPEPLAGRVSIVNGGTPQTNAGVADRLDIKVAKEPLILEYDFPLPAGTEPSTSAPFAVSLVVPEEIAQGETRLRIWSDLGSVPLLASGPWEEQELEPTDKACLPELVVRSGRSGAPLMLRRAPASSTTLAAVQVERVFVHVTIGDSGLQQYQVRFLLRRILGRQLDITLPAPVASLNLKVQLNGREIHTFSAEEGPSPGGRIHVPVPPALQNGTVLLDVAYLLPPSRSWAAVAWQSTLQPPVLKDAAPWAEVRWLVEPAPAWLALDTASGYRPGLEWNWQDGLFSLRPADTLADLENWSTGAETPGKRDGREAEDYQVFWRTSVAPVSLFTVPQRAWLLLCSLALLAVGLSLYFVAWPRGVLWFLVGMCALVIAGIGLIWPGLLAAVCYGCQPGVLVLLLFLGVQAYLHRRYRRKVLFLPGFQRRQTGSSLLTTGIRPSGQPSTVDAPPPGNSSGS